MEQIPLDLKYEQDRKRRPGKGKCNVFTETNVVDEKRGEIYNRPAELSNPLPLPCCERDVEEPSRKQHQTPLISAPTPSSTPSSNPSNAHPLSPDSSPTHPSLSSPTLA
jgi:hypothetical protein